MSVSYRLLLKDRCHTISFHRSQDSDESRSALFRFELEAVFREPQNLMFRSCKFEQSRDFICFVGIF
jgi:hypothetical protein